MCRKRIFLLMISLFVFLSACSSEEQSTKMTHDLQSNDWTHLKDLGVDAATIEAYDFAVHHPEVLNYIPCYCGCHHDAGHKNNTDCFVDQIEDNVAILDDMGLG